jgi:hypothetical protein
MSPAKVDAFLARGYKRRHFFPHSVLTLPRAGPDGLLAIREAAGIDQPDGLWELILYAEPPVVDEFPRELFFDRDLAWHQQHFGKVGQIATANLAVDGDRLYGTNYLSDLVQRISRRREHKTRVENRFAGWVRLLLNSVMNFAQENDIRTVYSPRAELVERLVDPARTVDGALFQRIYDRTLLAHWNAQSEDGWWRLDLRENAERIVEFETLQTSLPSGRTICLCHDIERGLGHLDAEPEFAERIDGTARRALGEMLQIEKELEVRATYNVVGLMFNEVRDSIESVGHCLGFHSFDHVVPKDPLPRADNTPLLDQLSKCRNLDYRIRGYRPPQSKITADLSEEYLARFVFDWLASSRKSIGVERPEVVRRIAKIPIEFDDYALHRGDLDYPAWERWALEKIAANDFVAFSLHDCYAEHWLPQYREFLEKVRGLGTLRTLDEVADRTFLEASR